MSDILCHISYVATFVGSVFVPVRVRVVFTCSSGNGIVFGS